MRAVCRGDSLSLVAYRAGLGAICSSAASQNVMLRQPGGDHCARRRADSMRRRTLSRRVLGASTKLACTILVGLGMGASVSLAQAEEPSAAALRFYTEYMGMGVALKPLGERWFTTRFLAVMDGFDMGSNAVLQTPTEGNPILPWKNWDVAWRNKLKAEVLQTSADRALVVVTFATDENGHPIARLVHLEKVREAWRVDDVSDPPH
jgi:hypothetical protein